MSPSEYVRGTINIDPESGYTKFVENGDASTFMVKKTDIDCLIEKLETWLCAYIQHVRVHHQPIQHFAFVPAASPSIK